MSPKPAFISAIPFVRAVCVTSILCGAAIAAPNVTLAQSVNVPVKHAETNGVDAVQFFAAQRSKNALVVVVYGNDQPARNAASAAAADALAKGYPVKGIVYGPKYNASRAYIECYANGQMTGEFVNPDQSDQAAIYAEMVRGYNTLIKKS